MRFTIRAASVGLALVSTVMLASPATATAAPSLRHVTVAHQDPATFRDPTPQAIAAHAEQVSPRAETQGATRGVTPNEVHVALPYCRTGSGIYYWMGAGANPWNCSQGYVKYYDSVYSNYEGAIDVWSAWYHATRSTAFATGWAWCQSFKICDYIVGGILYDGVKRMWPLLLLAE